MGKLLIFITIISLNGTVLAQLKGKSISLEMRQDLFCGSSLHFISDSLAFQYQGCEERQWFRPFIYQLLKDGTVKLDTIPVSQFQPWTTLYRTELVLTARDSIYGASSLVIENNTHFLEDVAWHVYIDSQLVATGGDLQLMQMAAFDNPRVSFSIPRFDLLSGRIVHFHASDFSGEGDRWVIRSPLSIHDLYLYDLYYPGSPVIQPEKGEKLLYLNGQFFLEKNGKRLKLPN